MERTYVEVMLTGSHKTNIKKEVKKSCEKSSVTICKSASESPPDIARIQLFR